ncbi:FecR family protein [Persicitalea jodogahamensis]|uniref:Iron dicitrate transporter FecR n=1 Tax=Persicitalea jodogahamensis TaxID=402147 RepID=A0A8J3D7P6_9BACT|nr:FecR family protein [Persicitalea jodogahamensis]GHB63819.1 iron dicitrate transporter FecR [Persicitalea jodogahamensis]
MANKRDPIGKADLIYRYLKGELSYSEEEEIRKWAEEDTANQQLLEKLENEEAVADDLQFFSSVDKESAWENITKTIGESSVERPALTFRYWRYAAAAMVVGILTFVVLKNAYKGEGSKIATVDAPSQPNDVLPGGDKGTLTFSDGSQVLLEDMANGTFREENGIRISKKDGQIIYEIIDHAGKQHNLFNTISTPVGGQYHIILPDGSGVWLNSESSLHFPTAFSGSKRRVKLTGEGYFEIKKDESIPFEVEALNTRVQVLGTHFNLMAYANEAASKTTLLEGSVKVSNGLATKIIKPGQQAIARDKIQIKTIDTDEVVAWKNGYFQFENEDLRTILRQLKRWYDVDVENSEQIPDKHFTAFISRNTPLSQVLKMLELSGELKFKIEGKKIFIQKNK